MTWLSAVTSSSTMTADSRSSLGRWLTSSVRARTSPATMTRPAPISLATLAASAASFLAFSSQVSSTLRWYLSCDQPPTEVLCTGHCWPATQSRHSPPLPPTATISPPVLVALTRRCGIGGRCWASSGIRCGSGARRAIGRRGGPSSVAANLTLP